LPSVPAWKFSCITTTHFQNYRLAHRNLTEPHTLILFDASKPSSWFRSSSMVRCTSLSPLPDPDSILADPIESISSMNIMDGACSLQQENHIINSL
jgi:hypothetical protein